MPAMHHFENTITLAFLKATSPQIPYWAYFTFKVQLCIRTLHWAPHKERIVLTYYAVSTNHTSKMMVQLGLSKQIYFNWSSDLEYLQTPNICLRELDHLSHGRVKGMIAYECTSADDILLPMSLSGEVDMSRGSCPTKKSGFFWTRPKTSTRPTWLWKHHCPCILEGHFSTNPILSALQLQGPKSNIYVHFHWVNRQLTGISFLKWNRQSSM